MRLGCWLGKPNQLRALAPIAHAGLKRGWTVRWYGPGVVGETPHPRDLPDAMVSTDPPKTPTPWIWLQAGMDPFSDPALPGTTATLAVYTEWWAAQLPAGVRSATVGFPMLPPGQGDHVLVYVPWSVRSGSPSRWLRWQNARAHRRLIRALTAYLDIVQDMPLRVKTRAKDPIPPSLRALADDIVDDESGAGDTLGWLAGAWGCVHVYSSVVLECAALGVPSLCLDPGPGWGNTSKFAKRWHKGPFNWPGVAYWRDMTVAPFTPVPVWRIDDDELKAYRARYVGPVDGAAERVCDLAEKMA